MCSLLIYIIVGINPGPCPSEAEKCVVNQDEVGGTQGAIEIWELTCKSVSLQDIDVSAPVSAGSPPNSVATTVTIQDLFQECSGKVRFVNVAVPLADEPSCSSVKAVINGEASFATNPAVNQGLSLEADFLFSSSETNGFDANLPDFVEITRCEIPIDVSEDLGISLDIEGSRFDDLLICSFCDASEDCGFDISFFVRETIINGLINSFDDTFARILCDEFVESAVVVNPVSGLPEDGVLNVELDALNVEFDKLLLGAADDVNLRDSSPFLQGLSYIPNPDAFDNSLRFDTDPFAIALSQVANFWLSESNENGGLLLNDLVDYLTEPDGSFVYDFLQNGVDLTSTLGFSPVNVSINLQSIELNKLNTIHTFGVLTNNYEDPNPGNRRQYTTGYNFRILEGEMKLNLGLTFKRGEWVTLSSCSTSTNVFTPSCTSDQSTFSFSYTIALSDLAIDAQLLWMLDWAEFRKINLGAILNDAFSTGGTLDAAQRFAQCISQASYAFNFTSLDVTVAQFTSIEVDNFATPDYNDFIRETSEVINAISKEALRLALPNIAQGVVREAANEFVTQEIVSPSVCEASSPLSSAPQYVEFDKGLASGFFAAVNGLLGGSAISTEPNINTALQLYLESIDFIYTMDASATPGRWVLKNEFAEDLLLEKFRDPSAFVNLGFPLVINNLNTLSTFLVTNIEAFAFTLDFAWTSLVPQDSLNFSTTIEVVAPQSIHEKFNLTLALHNLTGSVRWTSLKINLQKLNALTAEQLQRPVCLATALDAFTFAPPLLTSGSNPSQVVMAIDRIVRDLPCDNALCEAVDDLETDLSLGTTAATQSMLNFLLSGVLKEALGALQGIDLSVINASNCLVAPFPSVFGLVTGVERDPRFSFKTCSEEPAPKLTAAQALGRVQGFNASSSKANDFHNDTLIGYLRDRLDSVKTPLSSEDIVSVAASAGNPFPENFVKGKSEILSSKQLHDFEDRFL